jgi:cholesterol transport system auxiliary component
MKMNLFNRISLLLLICVAMSGCTLLSPVQSGPSNTYLVSAVPSSVVSRSHHSSATLFVAAPIANPLYSTSSMMYSTYAYQIDSFVKSSWAATPSQMLQPLVVQTLQNTHHFRTVSSTVGVGQFDYMLTSQLVKFQQDFVNGRSVFRLTLQVQLIRSATNAIIASKEFVIVEPAPENNPYGGVVAANRAADRMLRELARFCLGKI